MNVSRIIPLLIGGLLLVVVFVHFLLHQRSRTKAGLPIDRQLSSPVFRDDDRYWYGGFFYYNPDDSAVFVPKRYGLGLTPNFGHPLGRLVTIGLLLVPLVLSLLTILFQH